MGADYAGPCENVNNFSKDVIFARDRSINDDGTGAAVSYFDFNHQKDSDYELKFIEIGKTIDRIRQVLEKKKFEFNHEQIK